jgi:hypothetical protein
MGGIPICCKIPVAIGLGPDVPVNEFINCDTRFGE